MNNILTIKDLTSYEYFKNQSEQDFKNKNVVPVIDNVSFFIKENSCVALGANHQHTVKLVCEIIANIIPYKSAEYFFKDQYISKSKQDTLFKNIYYINSHESIFFKMNVLEYIMYVLNNGKKKQRIKRQLFLINLLEELGMEGIILTSIDKLTDCEKLLVLLVSSILSTSDIIVCDFSNYNFTDSEIKVLSNITKRAVKERKTIVLGTIQNKIAGICCDEIIYFAENKIKYFGNVKKLIEQRDRVQYIIRDANLEKVAKDIKLAFKDLEIEIIDNMILISRQSEEKITPQDFYETLSNNNIFPDEIKINRGRVNNSIQEILENDI